MTDRSCASENGAKDQPAALTHHADLVTELYQDFRRLDRDNDHLVSAAEVEAFLGRPGLTKNQLELGHFLKDNYDDVSKMTGYRGEIEHSGIDHLKDVLNPVNAPPPDAAKTIVRAAIGGAAGGGTVAYFQDDSVSKAAGKGAAVGAAIGVIAQAVEQAQYNKLQKEREHAASFHYVVCNDASSKAPSRADDLTAVEAHQAPKPDKPASMESLSPQVEQFRKTLPKIDFNDDGVVSAAELNEAIRSDYIAKEQKPLAAALAKNIEAVASLSSQPGGLTDRGLHELSLTLQPDHHDALKEARKDQLVTTGIGVAAGAFWGSVIGFAVGGPVVGCIIGATLLGSALYAYKNKEVSHVKEWHDSLRAGKLSGTIHDLQFMSQPDSPSH